LSDVCGPPFLLGHGDGGDNDSNGTVPPGFGPRDYDTMCDSLGYTPGADSVPIEDFCTPIPGGACGTCPAGDSLMHSGGLCAYLHLLQIEHAQEVAAFTPGVIGPLPDPSAAIPNTPRCASPPCGLPGD